MNNKGFSLVELIVVMAVLALLAVGSVIAFNGIQNNARRSALTSDANALASAINIFNATTGAATIVANGTFVDIAAALPAGQGTITLSPDGTSPSTITFETPAIGMRAVETSTLTFDTSAHRNRALRYIDYNSNFATVATTDIQNLSRERLTENVLIADTMTRPLP